MELLFRKGQRCSHSLLLGSAEHCGVGFKSLGVLSSPGLILELLHPQLKGRVMQKAQRHFRGWGTHISAQHGGQGGCRETIS